MDSSFTHSWLFYPIFSQFSHVRLSQTTLIPPFPIFCLPFPKHPAVIPIQSRIILPVHSLMCPLAVTPFVSLRCSCDSPWWGDAHPEQPASSLRFFGSFPPCCYALCSPVCVEMSFYLTPWQRLAFCDIFLLLFLYARCISSAMLITWRALGWVNPFSSFSLKSVRLRIKQQMLVAAKMCFMWEGGEMKPV